MPGRDPVDVPRQGGRPGGSARPDRADRAAPPGPPPLVAAIDQRPLLRLHCAALPAPAEVGRPAWRSGLYPPHPVHGDRTWAIEFGALTGDGGRTMRRLLSNGVRPEPAPAGYLAEYLLRPCVAVFRELLEHGVANGCCPSPRFLGHELAPDGRFTGRLVLGLPADVAEGAPAVPAVDGWVRRIASHCAALVEQFRRCGGAGAGPDGPVDAVLSGILAEELRFLPPPAAAALDGEHPWREFVHSVDPAQDSALRQLLATVAELATRRRRDSSLPRPVVVADPAELAGVPGFGRLVWDVYDVGGEVVPAAGAETDLDRCEVVATLTRSRDGGCRLSGRATVATLEMAPRSRAGVSGAPTLSYARSLGELQVGELRAHRLAREHVVRLTAAQSLDVIGGLVRYADAAAESTGKAAFGALRSGRLAAAGDDPVAAAATLIHRVLTRKQFIKGSRSHYPVSQAITDLGAAIAAGRPVRFVLRGFPFKQCESGLKALGPLPDLAELGALVRLRELQLAVRQVYPPGAAITVLTDGRHFRRRPATALRCYRRKLVEYLAVAGVSDRVELVDVDERAEAVLGTGISTVRVELIDRYQAVLSRMFAHLDITRDPLGVLRDADVAEYLANAAGSGGPTGAAHAGTGPVFRDLFKSIAFSVPVPLPAGADRMAWSRAVYADLYDLTGGAGADVVAARRQVLREAWRDTIRYVSAFRSDRDLGYDQLFAGAVRLRPGSPQPGGCGFAFLGGSCLLPWHGTGAVSPNGEVSTDFAVALYDQGFVPVVSPLLGPDQPWMMVPVNRTSGRELDGRFVSRIRLRRK